MARAIRTALYWRTAAHLVFSACVAGLVTMPFPASAQGSGTTAAVVSSAGADAGAASVTKVAGKRCRRLAFEVNDYGKDGPTRDAKALLDKHIATWAKSQGIKSYSIGPKAVNCKLFLDVILFDEHTCRAEAAVCW